MFEVKGWNISGAPKTQKPSDKPKTAADGADAPKGKKRKRGRDKPKGQQVTLENAAELWENVFGKDPAKAGGDTNGTSKPDKKKRKKEGKDHATGSNDMAVGSRKEQQFSNGGHSDEVKPEEKKRKQEKKAKKEKTKGSIPKGAPTSSDGLKPSKPPKVVNTSPSAAPASAPIPTAAPPLPPATKLTPLQAKMRQKLISARFRHLNETLYTTPSTNSLKLIDESPEVFNEYHEGFRRQVEAWPENPVDGYTKSILERGRIRENRFGQKKGHGHKKVDVNKSALGEKVELGEGPLPRTHSTCTIADLGCGDAALSSALQPHASKLHLKIHSFDLASKSPLVTKADIANLPLRDGEVDVAIFCLALMGTNWIDFIEEAYRVLHWKGELWVAEIKSRFGRVEQKKGKVVEHSVGKRQKKIAAKKEKKTSKERDEEDREKEEALAVEVDGVETKSGETDVGAFVEVLRRRGFVLDQNLGDAAVDLSNKMFVKMRFVKAAHPSRGKGFVRSDAGQGQGGRTKRFVEVEKEDLSVEEEGKVLKPCVYKLR